MPAEMRPVFSSHVAAIGYDPETSELHVTYKSGKTSIWSDVPADVAAKVGALGGTPPSIGEALHEHVRGRGYPHSYAED